jgi:hypothetical protein
MEYKDHIDDVPGRLTSCRKAVSRTLGGVT